MSTVEMMDPKEFYDDLVVSLGKWREGQAKEAQGFGAARPMGKPELIEWLQFQCWYEREAANFIGSWLKDTPEPEAFFGLCRQIADEGKHCKLILAHLESLGASMDGWTPEPEWVEWVQEFYAHGDDTLERVSAHNITGEIGVMNAFEGLMPRIPAATQHVLKRIMPDETFHVALGRTIVHRYATTADRQARVRARVRGAFELEQKGRIAFDRRLQSLASAG
jgi:hypothetical protein